MHLDVMAIGLEFQCEGSWRGHAGCLHCNRKVLGVLASRVSNPGLSGRGEMIPNDDSYCEIDPDTVDRWGIPVLRFHFRWSEHEILQVKHMHETFTELIEHLGGTPLTPMPTKEENYGILPGGRIIHEVGVTRMGNSRRTSVLNAYCQAHDVKNVFVADGGPLVSNPNKNPTWTILALAMRTSDYIAEERRKGNI